MVQPMDRRKLLFGLAVASAFALAPPVVAKADEKFATDLAPEFDFGSGSFTVEALVQGAGGEWSHLAADGEKDRVRTFKNGTRVLAEQWHREAAEAKRIDKVRITKGLARYASGGGFPAFPMS